MSLSQPSSRTPAAGWVTAAEGRQSFAVHPAFGACDCTAAPENQLVKVSVHGRGLPGSQATMVGLLASALELLRAGTGGHSMLSTPQSQVDHMSWSLV